MASLTGRLALVTGAGSGIGRAVCRVFEREGASVAVVDQNEKNASETANFLQDKSKVFVSDISNGNSVSSLLENVKQHFSQVPCIAVNCAGITRDKFLLKMSEEQFDDVINVNLKGTFLVTQAVSRLMVENKISPGSIVNISSITGKVGNIGQSNYTASKAGVIAFTKTSAKELGRFGIRCNVILPGFIQTPMVETVPEHLIEMAKLQIPAGRLGNPEEVAEACAFLASEKSSYITGSALEVTGGLWM